MKVFFISSKDEYGYVQEIHSSLKVTTVISNECKEFHLSLPKSRIRTGEPKSDFVHLSGFMGRVQREYMTCPVGPYAGPYDQNEKLKLNIQLPLSDLDYKAYSEFIHNDTVACAKFLIGAKYLQLDDLEKIDCFEIKERNSEIDKEEEEEEEESDSDENLVYTCIKQKCEIPCLCHLCAAGTPQC